MIEWISIFSWTKSIEINKSTSEDNHPTQNNLIKI